MNQPFVSVLLPVRGESDELVECLASLAAQTYPRSRFEVLIADGSDIAIQPAIVPAGVDVRVIPNPEHLMSRGLNRVAGHARGDYLAIVSAHSALPADYLERMAATIQATGAANAGTRVRKVARTTWGRAIAAATSSPLGVGSSIQHHGTAAGPANSAFPGFIERATFDALGGFNPELACNEDDEFNARLRAAGGLVWYEPAIEVVYHPRETPGGVVRQHYRYGRWKVAVARLGVAGYLRPRHLVPSLAVAGAVGLTTAAIAWRPMVVPLVTSAVLYGGLVAVESRRMAGHYGAEAWRVAAIFPLVHGAYGVGFLRGLLDRGLPDEGSSREGPTVAGGDAVEPAPAGPSIHAPGPTYRRFVASDAPTAAELHRAVFRDYFLGRMGQRFLELFYAEFDRPGNYGFVALVEGRLVGTVIGSTDLARMFNDFYRRNFPALARAYLVQAIRDTYVRRNTAARLAHVVKAVQSRLGLRPSSAPDPKAWPPAQLLSIGVAEEHRGAGIAEALTERFCTALAADGVDAVGLSVRSDNARAAAFYVRTGWVLDRSDAKSSTYWKRLSQDS